MAKYSYEFKLHIVQEYLSGKGSAKSLAKQYSVPSDSQIRRWIWSYQNLGAEGLMRCREKKSYSFQIKKHAVELYLTTDITYSELAASLGISTPSLITHWVADYRAAGPGALKPKNEGRRVEVAKPKRPQSGNSNDAYLKQLEEENYKLRLENAYLKELRRLRLEEEARNGKRGLPTVSEKTSN